MTESLDIDFKPADNERLANLCGPMNEHLRQIEARLGVEINNRNHHFQLIGMGRSAPKLVNLYQKLLKNQCLSKLKLFCCGKRLQSHRRGREWCMRLP